MKDIELFQIALGISSPWFVKSLELDPITKKLDIHLDFQKGSKFTCPECGAEGRKVHDTAAKTWRHPRLGDRPCLDYDDDPADGREGGFRQHAPAGRGARRRRRAGRVQHRDFLHQRNRQYL